MNQKALVSVIIPTINSELYLDECINSVLNQSYKNIELIIVDGGSKDRTTEIIRHYQQNNKHIQLFVTQCCVSFQRNYGITKCKGDYVFFLDSDDYLELNFFVEMLNTIETNNLDVVTPFFERNYYINNVLTETNYTDFELDDSLVTKDNFFEKGYRSYIASQCKLYKKSLLQNIKKYDNLNFGEDLLFNYSIALKQPFRYGISISAIYHYRKNIAVDDASKRLNAYSLNFFSAFLEVVKQQKKGTKNYQGAFLILKDNLKAFINAFINNNKHIPFILWKSRIYVFVSLKGKNKFFYLQPKIFNKIISRKKDKND